MRIAFTGSHRTGKTTLAELLTEHLTDYEFKSEPYIQLEEQGYEFSEIPEAEDYIEQFNLSVKQIRNSAEDAIFDRCPLDLLAYIHTLEPHRNISEYWKEMSNALSEIDLLIFVPIETPDVISCQKCDLPDLRHRVNDILLEWIDDDLNCEVLAVKGTPANRKKQVLNKIRELKDKNNL